MGIFSDVFTQIKAEEGFKIVIRNIIRGGLTPEHLEVMALGKISLRSLLEPEHLRKMRERKDSSEVQYLARMDGLKPDYLLGLLTQAAPQHGKVLARHPEYAKQMTTDLRDILSGK
ncbi:MAG: hypothetical protein Q8P23_00880 [bacterium]|nr:hypothetical protein [bacterium]